MPNSSNHEDEPPYQATALPLDIQRLIQSGVVQPPRKSTTIGSVDQYELLGLLGTGGMGIVVMAWDRRHARKVAIKFLRPELLGCHDVIHRFEVEARHMQRMSHPNIVSIESFCKASIAPYLVMRLIEGLSLSKVINHRPMHSAAALNIALQVARALHYAHQERGIFHRDVKPQNVLIDESQRAFLTDFGLGRTTANDSILINEVGLPLGTPAYMSPAVARGQAEDTRSDIYSFGATLYHMLTGSPPYQGANRNDILNAIRSGPPIPIVDRNPNAPQQLAHVSEGAMQRELRDRYADMGNIVEDLERLDRGEVALGPHPNHSTAIGVSFWRSTLIAIVASLLIAVSCWYQNYWRSADKTNRGAENVPASRNQLPGESVNEVQPSLAIASVSIEGYRGNPTQPLGTIGKECFRTRFGDTVRISIQLNKPAYCYLIAINPDGRIQYCLPQMRPLEPGSIWHYPVESRKVFPLTDDVGLQAFVAVAMRDPLPDEFDWQELVEPSLWRECRKSDGVWKFDGRQFIPLGTERGPVQDMAGLPVPFANSLEQLRQVLPDAVVQATAFPVDTAD